MEFIQKNARAIIIALLVAGVVVLISLSSSNGDDTQNEETSSETAESETTDSESTEQEATESEESSDNSENETESESQPARNDDNSYEITAVRGDNQTTLVRKIVSDYADANDIELSAEQALFAETTLVQGLPKSDLIFVGETIRLSDEQLKLTFDQAAELTESQIAAWGQYL
jgi:flagellum-specific peptidoglycan hydrolase FlgJ